MKTLRIASARLSDMHAEQTSTHTFVTTAVVIFVVCAVVTYHWCVSISNMEATMMWMPMDGQTWWEVAAAFLAMWNIMMVAMMLPMLMPMLWRYRLTVGRTAQTHLGWLTLLVGGGYFFVWSVIGMAVFVLGVATMALQMQLPALTRAVPIAVGMIILFAGAIQFTRWKADQLACCRSTPGCGCVLSADTGTAWRHGLRLGRHCFYCCANLMAILVVTGMMDLHTMLVVTAAMTAERLAPANERVMRAIGVVVIAAGVVLIAQAIRLMGQ